MAARSLTPALQLIAQIELNENPLKVEQNLKYIRKWLAEQLHLNVREDEQWLLNFLRGCKFNLERTKQKLDLYYSVRTLVPQLFAERDPFSPKIQDILNLGLCVPLPKTLNSSQPVLFIRHRCSNKNGIHILDVIRVILMTYDILLNENDNLIICGNQIVEDLKGLPLKHMFQMTPNNCLNVRACFQNAYPIRPKKVHFLNAPAFFDSLFKIIQPLLGEKLRKRVKIYNAGNLNGVYDHIPRSVLPEEYGGEDISINEMAAEWKNKVESYKDWFLNDAQYCSNELKRLDRSFVWSLFDSIYKR